MKRRQTAVYSPGGCGCGLLLLPVIAVSIGVMFAFAGLAAAALVLLIVAIGVTIWLCRSREQRRADGKTNAGWAIFLVVAYLLSISYLAFFILLLVSTITGESVMVGESATSLLKMEQKWSRMGNTPIRLHCSILACASTRLPRGERPRRSR